MARNTNIKLRRSATAGALPTTSQLDLGEIALNTYDGKAYMKKDVGGTTSIVQIGSSEASASDILKEFQYDGSDGASSNTVFSGSDNNSNTLTYTVGALQVYLNGVLLQPTTDYTAANGVSITLINAAANADLLQIIAWYKTIGTGLDTVQALTGVNGSNVAFTLTTEPTSENQTAVYIDGVYQNKTTYAVSGTTLTFSTAPPNGTTVEVVTHSSNIYADNITDLTITGTMTANAFAGALTGNVTGTISTLSNHDTDDLSEGSGNLYYTNARADARITAADTDDLSEGTTNLYHTSERVDDRVNALIVAGSNITKTYDDTAGTLTLASTQLTTEQVQDVVGAMFTSNTETRGSLVYDDTDGTIDLVVDDMTANTTYSAGTGLALSSTTFSLSHLGLEALTDPDADRIFFWDDSAGAAKFLTLGTGLSITGTTLAGSALYTDSDARGAISVTDSGGDGSLAYNSSTGVITYTGPSAAEVRAHLSAGTGMTFSGGAFATTITQYTTALARATISVTDSGGDGSLAYNSTTGVITYTGPSAAEVRAHISAGTGVAISSGAISIGQAVATSSDVTFNDLTVSGDFTVSGDTTTVNTATLSVEDPLIIMASGNNAADVVDIGFYGLYDTSGSQDLYSGLFRDASDSGKWKLFKDNQAAPTTTVNTSGTGYATGTLVANLEGNVTGNVTGNTSGSSGSTTGNAATATALATARTIGGTSFDGTANIAVALAGTATTLATARTIGGTSFDGSANIAVALSATATALATARTIGGVSFDGTANINLPGVNAAGNQDTTGNAATVTNGVYTTGAQTIAGVKTFSSAIVSDLTGNVTGNVTGNASGTALTVTQAAQTAITSLGSLTGLDVNGAVTINDNLSLDGSNKELRFYEGANYVGFEAPALSADQIWVLPTADGSSGYALKTDGSGNLSWGLAGGNAFETIAVSGQSNIVADSSSDTLTIAAGTGITLTTAAGSDTLTITNSATGDDAFKTIAVSGQTSVVADATDDTLTLVAGAGMAITTDASADSITISGVGTVNPFMTDLFTTANSSTTAFTTSQAPADEDAMMVFIEGVYQNQNSYTLSGTTVTLDTAPASGQEVVIHTIATGVTGTGHNSDQFTGNGSTAAYTLSVDPITEDNCFAFFDGVYQNKSTFSVSGTTITFDGNVTSGTAIEVITPTITAVNVPTTGSVSPAKLSTGGPTWNTTGQVTIDSDLSIGMTTTSVTSGSATTICTLAGATYRSAKLEISIKDATASEYESTEVLMVHNGSTTSITEYGQIYTGSAALGTISATYSGGNVLIQYTRTGSNTHTIKVKHSAIKV